MIEDIIVNHLCKMHGDLIMQLKNDNIPNPEFVFKTLNNIDKSLRDIAIAHIETSQSSQEDDE